MYAASQAEVGPQLVGRATDVPTRLASTGLESRGGGVVDEVVSWSSRAPPGVVEGAVVARARVVVRARWQSRAAVDARRGSLARRGVCWFVEGALVVLSSPWVVALERGRGGAHVEDQLGGFVVSRMRSDCCLVMVVSSMCRSPVHHKRAHIDAGPRVRLKGPRVPKKLARSPSEWSRSAQFAHEPGVDQAGSRASTDPVENRRSVASSWGLKKSTSRREMYTWPERRPVDPKVRAAAR